MIRFPAKLDAPRFPLTHVWQDRTWWQQGENEADNPKAVGEVTKPGKKSYGLVNAPSKKYRESVLLRRFFDQRKPPGLDGDDYHGTEKAFLGEFEDDGQWSGKILNPWTATPGELAEVPECIKARFVEHADDCECETASAIASDATINKGVLCECETASAIAS